MGFGRGTYGSFLLLLLLSLVVVLLLAVGGGGGGSILDAVLLSKTSNMTLCLESCDFYSLRF